MKSEQLQAIRERVNKATPGPWWDESGIIHAPHPENWSPDNHSCVHVARVDDELGENGEFIAHAREDVPALLDEIERLNPYEKELGKALHDVVFWQENNKQSRAQANGYYTELLEARKEIERLRGVLEWYANPQNYAGIDFGSKARQALEVESE